MDNYMEHQLICRACLRIVENKSQSFGYIEDTYGNLKDMIMCCVPEMDIYVSSQPIMCFPCIQLLIMVYNFKTRCLNTETVIRSYIQRNNLTEYNHVNLGCVVQELTKLNNYFQDMNRGKVESCPNNVHFQINENSCKPESQMEMQLGSDIDKKPCIEHENTVQVKESDENELVKDQIDCLLDKNEEQIIKSGLDNRIVQNGFPQQHFYQNNLPVCHMGDRPFHFPPPHVPYNFQDRIGENMIPPHLNLERRNVPYNLPVMRSHMPERIFHSPQFGADQRFAPRCIVPEQIGERFYAFMPTGSEPRLPNYNLPLKHTREHNFYRPSVKVEDAVTQDVSIDSGANNPNAQPFEVDKEISNDRTAENYEKGEESCVERNVISKNNNNEGLEPHVNDEKGENNNEQVQNKAKIILRIDKSRIKNWFKLCEEKKDLDEKENKQDVEMSEAEMSPPHEGVLPQLLDSSQELYQCSNCMFVTTNLTSHMSHKDVCLHDVPRSEKMKCPHCPHVTNRQYALKKHINTMHTKAVWYNCEYCSYRSTDPSCLRRHMRNMHTEKLGMDLTCPMCSYRCTTEYHLRKHMSKHDENSILHCQFCSYSTRDRSNFRKHVFIHNPKPRECEFCEYKCVSPYQMKIHLKKYHHGVGLEDIDCKSDVSLSAVVDDISNAIKQSKTFVGHNLE